MRAVLVIFGLLMTGCGYRDPEQISAVTFRIDELIQYWNFRSLRLPDDSDLSGPYPYVYQPRCVYFVGCLEGVDCLPEDNQEQCAYYSWNENLEVVRTLSSHCEFRQEASKKLHRRLSITCSECPQEVILSKDIIGPILGNEENISNASDILARHPSYVAGTVSEKGVDRCPEYLSEYEERAKEYLEQLKRVTL